MSSDSSGFQSHWSSELPSRRGSGLRIGLFGGSFNPAHEGHRLASLIALRRLRLDRVWWLISPGNPLKDRRELEPLAARVATARRVANHPAIDVTTVEAALGFRYTADIVDVLTQRCRDTRFVWIMGADNLAGFPRWQRWTDIIRSVPIAIVDRPGATVKGRQGQAGSYLARWQLPEAAASTLASAGAPGVVALHGPRSTQSSTALRAALRHDDRDARRESS